LAHPPPPPPPVNQPLTLIPIDMMNNHTKTLSWSFFYKNNLRVAVGVSAGVAVEKQEQLTHASPSHPSHAQKVKNCTTDNSRNVMNGTRDNSQRVTNSTPRWLPKGYKLYREIVPKGLQIVP